MTETWGHPPQGSPKESELSLRTRLGLLCTADCWHASEEASTQQQVGAGDAQALITARQSSCLDVF